MTSNEDATTYVLHHNRSWIAELSPAFFAPVMGLAGLGISWRIAGSVLGAPPFVGEVLVLMAFIVFGIMTILSIYRIATCFTVVKAEVMDSTKLVFYPLIPTSGLLLSIGARPYDVDLAAILWMMSAPFNIYLAVLLTSRWIFKPVAKAGIVPAWLFPVVGNGVVPIAGVPLGFVEASWIFFSMGLVLWVLVFSALFQNLVLNDALPAKIMPSVLLLLSPPATFFIAYYELNNGVIDALSYGLIYISLFFLAVSAMNWQKLILVPTSITLWSLTFPLAALTISFLLFYKSLHSLWQGWTAGALLGLTSLSVSYVVISSMIALVRYSGANPTTSKQ